MDGDQVHPDEGAVERVQRAFYQAWEEDDLDLAMSLWVDDDAIAITFPLVEPLWGREIIRMRIEEGIGLTRGIQFLLEDLRIQVRGDVALFTCIENVVMPESMTFEELPSSRLAVSSTLLRTPDGWRIWSHAAGPVMPREEVE